MTERFSCRLARPDDFPAVADVKMDAALRYGPFYTSRPLSRELFDLHVKSGNIAVAVDEAEVPCGYVMFWDEGEDAYLHHLFVRTRCRGWGVGRALTDLVVDYARQGGKDAVTLVTGGGISWNAPHYRKLGFELLPDDGMPDYLAKELAKDRAHFTVENLPWIEKLPEVLPRVAMRKMIDGAGVRGALCCD